MYEIIIYKTASGKKPVKEYFSSLSKKSKTNDLAKIQLYINRLREYGMSVNSVFPNTIRQEAGDVYALRPGSHRIFFFYFTGNEIVLLHAYQKQSQKAPRNELRKATMEMNDHIERNRNG